MQVKTCNKCNEEKLLENFCVRKASKDGLSYVCRECDSKRKKSHYKENKDKILEKNKKYVRENKEKVREYINKWRRDNPECRNKYVKRKYKSDPSYRLLNCLRSRVYAAMIGAAKSASTMELVGCSIDKLKQHLESKFTEGMSWDNYGDWHVDHIKPCASFDLSDPEQQRLCFNYKNLQPLWAADNLSKADSII